MSQSPYGNQMLVLKCDIITISMDKPVSNNHQMPYSGKKYPSL